jgi:hypothetical protein
MQYVMMLTNIIVSLDMLFLELFIASSPKYYFRNPDWYMKWLGTVDCQ